jgi:hypothetical protein
MTVELEFARFETNAAFDRLHYWQQKLRDLLNASDNYTVDAFDLSARKIIGSMLNANLRALSKFHHFECLRERMEAISNTDPSGSDSPESPR